MQKGGCVTLASDRVLRAPDAKGLSGFAFGSPESQA